MAVVRKRLPAEHYERFIARVIYRACGGLRDRPIDLGKQSAAPPLKFVREIDSLDTSSCSETAQSVKRLERRCAQVPGNARGESGLGKSG